MLHGGISSCEVGSIPASTLIACLCLSDGLEFPEVAHGRLGIDSPAGHCVNVFMCVYVHVYVCVHVHLHVCRFVHIFVHGYVCACAGVCGVYVHACVNICVV